MDIVRALRRICEDSKELEVLTNKNALPSKIRSACQKLERELFAILDEAVAAHKKQDGMPVQWYETAMRFLREALAIRYDQAHYRSSECSDVSIIHASWLEMGQLLASGRTGCHCAMQENGHSYGKALGPAAKRFLALTCDHVFEKSPPRTQARLLIEDGRAVKDDMPAEPDMTNVVHFSRHPLLRH